MGELAATRAWLRTRVDNQVDRTLRTLLSSTTETLAVASATAASVRMLSEDDALLLPVAAHHPDPHLRSKIASVMDRTAPRPRSGIWRPVVDCRRAVRLRIDRDRLPPEASPEQREFLLHYPLTAMLGVPLEHEGRLVGGASLVRFSVDMAFTDDDEALLYDFAARVAPLLGILRQVSARTTSGP
ncbi:GAF domain-containing protein [Pseudonocardia halophobica]|uniref:GAF domain-containing protein n=1 Tax=Pseudonocardia halophobica TaxID=29401 RepID=UPI00055A2638|nr:GAF domain-containing protein [Pseudonocardia halophobica]